MPRRAAISASLADTSSPVLLPGDDPESSYSANLRFLRTHWKWAAFGQFFYTFAALFNMPEVKISDVEDDLARASSLYIPRVMQRLLYTLTQDRKINIDNWQSSLRKQYLRRDPDANPLGPDPNLRTSTRASSILPDASNANDASNDVEPEEDPLAEDIDWFDLPLLTKLDSLHTLTEWQFQNPLRFRSVMKDDDETAQWRIEPIGYDAKTNAYWLIGADRLWIQRAPPRAPRPPKRKRPAPKPKPKPKAIVQESSSEEELPPPTKRTRTRTNNGATSASASSPSSVNPRARKAKMQANQRLDAQYKELEAFQREAAVQKSRETPTKSISVNGTSTRASARRSLGTRVSRRLRGAEEDEEEWQEIPEEWLKEKGSEEEAVKGKGSANGKEKAKPVGRARALRNLVEDAVDEMEEDETQEDQVNDQVDDSMSELTELSELTPEPDEELEMQTKTKTKVKAKGRAPPKGRARGKAKGKAKTLVHPPVKEEIVEEDPDPEPEPEPEPEPPIPADFIEWEAIAITLEEWEHVADPFAKATHYLEKALYKMLSQVLVPAVTADLREIERQRKIEEAVTHRKRSSRIAIKESEKEQAMAMAKQQAEEAEKMARQRRAEARMRKEEAEREKRERAREQRRLEREERERRREEMVEQEAKSRSETRTPDVDPPAPTTRTTKPRASQASRKKESSDWILDCEVCKRYGKNLDGDQDLVSCGTCSRWQHIDCHDNADVRAGRIRRNWGRQQFTCARCCIEQATRRATLYTYPSTSGAGQWQDDSVHLHPTHSTPPWGTSNASGSQHHATLPTSDLRGSYPPSNHLTNHTSHSGVSYRTIPLSQSPQNILCSADGTKVFLSDFGLSTQQRISNVFGCGSSFYMSPECIGEETDHIPYAPKYNDVWSLGIILINMVTSRSPWEKAMTTDDCFHDYLIDKHFLRAMLPISKQLSFLLNKVFELDPTERCSLREFRAAVRGIKTFFMDDEDVALAPRGCQLAVRDIKANIAKRNQKKNMEKAVEKFDKMQLKDASVRRARPLPKEPSLRRVDTPSTSPDASPVSSQAACPMVGDETESSSDLSSGLITPTNYPSESHLEVPDITESSGLDWFTNLTTKLMKAIEPVRGPLRVVNQTGSISV